MSEQKTDTEILNSIAFDLGYAYGKVVMAVGTISAVSDDGRRLLTELRDAESHLARIAKIITGRG